MEQRSSWIYHHYHPFISVVLANILILLEPGLFSRHEDVSWFLQQNLYTAKS